jgi:hypothetical protein
MGFSRYALNVWISLKTLHSKVLTTFADHRCLLRFLTSSQWINGTVIASFKEKIGLEIVLFNNSTDSIITGYSLVSLVRRPGDKATV